MLWVQSGKRGRKAQPEDEANLRKQMSNNTLEYESCLDYVLPFPPGRAQAKGFRGVFVFFFANQICKLGSELWGLVAAR